MTKRKMTAAMQLVKPLPPPVRLVPADAAEIQSDAVGSMFGPATSLSMHSDGRGFSFRTGPGPRRVRS